MNYREQEDRYGFDRSADLCRVGDPVLALSGRLLPLGQGGQQQQNLIAVDDVVPDDARDGRLQSFQQQGLPVHLTDVVAKIRI